MTSHDQHAYQPKGDEASVVTPTSVNPTVVRGVVCGVSHGVAYGGGWMWKVLLCLEFPRS